MDYYQAYSTDADATDHDEEETKEEIFLDERDPSWSSDSYFTDKVCPHTEIDFFESKNYPFGDAPFYVDEETEVIPSSSKSEGKKRPPDALLQSQKTPIATSTLTVQRLDPLASASSRPKLSPYARTSLQASGSGGLHHHKEEAYNRSSAYGHAFSWPVLCCLVILGPVLVLFSARDGREEEERMAATLAPTQTPTAMPSLRPSNAPSTEMPTTMAPTELVTEQSIVQRPRENVSVAWDASSQPEWYTAYDDESNVEFWIDNLPPAIDVVAVYPGIYLPLGEACSDANATQEYWVDDVNSNTTLMDNSNSTTNDTLMDLMVLWTATEDTTVALCQNDTVVASSFHFTVNETGVMEVCSVNIFRRVCLTLFHLLKMFSLRFRYLTCFELLSQFNSTLTVNIDSNSSQISPLLVPEGTLLILVSRDTDDNTAADTLTSFWVGNATHALGTGAACPRSSTTRLVERQPFPVTLHVAMDDEVIYVCRRKLVNDIFAPEVIESGFFVQVDDGFDPTLGVNETNATLV